MADDTCLRLPIYEDVLFDGYKRSYPINGRINRVRNFLQFYIRVLNKRPTYI